MKKLGLGIAAVLLITVLALFFTGKLQNFMPGSADTIALFNGGEIKQQEILQIVQIDPGMTPEAIYNVKLAATVQRVKRRLLEIEAINQKTTPEELLTKVSSNSSPATDEELNLHLRDLGKEAAQLSAKELENAVKLVQNKKNMREGERYLDELFKNGKVRIFIDK